ncbi:MAG: chemotaxis protein CheA, partial [Planctomycetota bacterium]
MTPEELHRSLQGAASDLVFLDGDAPAEDWAVFVDRLGPLAAAAAACDCPILADAGELAGRIAAVLAAGDPGNPDAAVEHLNTLLTLMGVRAEELAEDRPPAQTYKAELAAARVYLDDLAGDEAPPAATATPAEDDEAAEFRQVMRGRIDAVEALLLGAEDTADEAELLRSVFREFHTLKGETGILGLTDLHNFFHDAESRMEPLRSESLSITADLVDALMAVADTSRRLIDGATGDDATTDDARAVLLDALGGAVAAAPPAEARTPDATDAATGEDDDAFFAAMADPPPAPDAASAQGAEDLFLQGAGASGEAEPTAPPLPDADAAEAPVPETEGVQVIPVDVGRIDSLLDLVATTTASAVQVGRHPLLAEQADTALRADLAILQRSIASLQDLAAGLRMTPVRPLFQRMRRVAYDVGRSSHKRVDIDVEGADTEVDRSVVENLTGALVHLIRNAIDHGIEAPADRRAAGKPERGRLLLRARRAGSNVAIEVVDDGAGIDPERVRAAAVGRGVIAPDARLPDRELRELIFHPGFSTAARVTGVSGRGVGMDAVRSAVEHLRGRVE